MAHNSIYGTAHLAKKLCSSFMPRIGHGCKSSDIIYSVNSLIAKTGHTTMPVHIQHSVLSTTAHAQTRVVKKDEKVARSSSIYNQNKTKGSRDMSSATLAQINGGNTLNSNLGSAGRTNASVQEIFEDLNILYPITTNEITSADRDVENPIKISLGEKRTSSSAIKQFSSIPGPKGWPLIGTLLDYVRKNGYGFKKIFQAQLDRSLQYGPIYKEKIGPEVMVVITDPKEYSKVVRTDAKYPKRMIIDPMVYYRQIRGLPIGLFNATGEEWYKYRKVLNPIMLDMKEAKNYMPRLNEVSIDFVDRLARVSIQTDFCLERELFKWALESIGVLLFDSRLDCFAEPTPPKTAKFIESVSGYTRTLQSLMMDFPWYRFIPTKLWKENVTCADVIYQIGQELIDEKKIEYERNRDQEAVKRYSILRSLLQTTSWTDKEINITLTDLMMAAIETTCFAVLWTMYCLAKNQRVQKKLYESILSVKKSHGGSHFVPLDIEKLYQITYLKHCVKEALRLYPVVYTTSRIIDKDLCIDSFEIPVNTHVQGSMYAMGRNGSLFDHPESFIPERWSPANITKLNTTVHDKMSSSNNMAAEDHINSTYFSIDEDGSGSTPSSNRCPFHNLHKSQVQMNESATSDCLRVRKMEKDVSNFASLPFGHGSRMCIGRRISEVEMYTLIWSLVQNYEIHLDDSQKNSQVDPVLHLVLCPANKIRINLVKRGGEGGEKI